MQNSPNFRFLFVLFRWGDAFHCHFLEITMKVKFFESESKSARTIYFNEFLSTKL